MREVSYEPRQFDPNRPSGSELTIGSIGKLSNAIADLNRRLDALEKAAPSAPLLIREARQ